MRKKRKNKDGGYSPVVPAPARQNRLVLDIPSAGPEPRTIQLGETLCFDVVSSCPKGDEDTDGNYENYLEHVKATGLQILCSCEDGAELSHPISR
jgi:hypothetical protein